jgi:signal transduction histidine kinase
MKATGPSNILFFLYDPITREVPYSSEDMELFFDASLDSHQDPPFLGAVNIHDLGYIAKEWQFCLQLHANASRHFSFSHAASGPNLIFDCSVWCVVLSSSNGSPGLLIHVKKSMAPSTPVKSASNYQKDYAEFIELAGHDLDAPLRKMSVLIERLVSKIDTSPEIDGYITRIQASVGDMRSMLDGLSTLASLTSGEMRREECDLNQIIQSVIASLSADHRARVQITSPLPTLQGDRMQYRQLFEQLIANAILFSSRNKETKIMISSTPESGITTTSIYGGQQFHKVVVADEGIGFSSEYADKIFKPFVRLHGKSEYPGHGMGLAICKRIVENHQGTIEAKSNTGEGARFILILPQTMT